MISRGLGSSSAKLQVPKNRTNKTHIQMKLQINGEERDFGGSPAPFTLAALVEILGMKADRVAVEKRVQDEQARWEKQKEKLAAALRRARSE